jgi:hypothetical protein
VYVTCFACLDDIQHVAGFRFRDEDRNKVITTRHPHFYLPVLFMSGKCVYLVCCAQVLEKTYCNPLHCKQYRHVISCTPLYACFLRHSFKHYAQWPLTSTLKFPKLFFHFEWALCQYGLHGLQIGRLAAALKCIK